MRVPGKKSPRTKAVDKLAKRSANNATTRQLNPSEIRRKQSDQPIAIGVPMEGQLMRINIFKIQYQPVHRLSRYWYTVESKSSPYYKRASIIYSHLHHLRRHTYRVRVNHDTHNPRILTEFGEVKPDKRAGTSPIESRP